MYDIIVMVMEFIQRGFGDMITLLVCMIYGNAYGILFNMGEPLALGLL